MMFADGDIISLFAYQMKEKRSTDSQTYVSAWDLNSIIGNRATQWLHLATCTENTIYFVITSKY